MPKTKSCNFQLLIDLQGIHQVINENGDILMLLIDRVGAATNKYYISLN